MTVAALWKRRSLEQFKTEVLAARGKPNDYFSAVKKTNATLCDWGPSKGLGNIVYAEPDAIVDCSRCINHAYKLECSSV